MIQTPESDPDHSPDGIDGDGSGSAGGPDTDSHTAGGPGVGGVEGGSASGGPGAAAGGDAAGGSTDAGAVTDAGSATTDGGAAGAGGAASGGAAGAGGTAAGGAPAAFPLTISADKKNLVDQNGTPFLMIGDAAWTLPTQLSDADTLRYLDDRKSRGFNTILIEAMEHKFGSRDPAWTNAAGQVPFGDNEDFTTARSAFFDRLAWLIEQARTRGILVLVTPAYIGFDCGDEGWCQEMIANGADKLRSYGQFLGQRLRDLPNLIWVEGGDLTPSSAQLTLINAIASGIKAGDGGNHLHTAHWSRSTSSSEGPSVDWLNIDATYSGALRLTYQDCLSDWARDAGKRPAFLIEGYYEGGEYSPVEMRAQMYQPLLSGEIGFVFGHHSIWFFGRPGDGNPGWEFVSGTQVAWTSALNSSGSRHATLTRDLFAPLPWSQLRPDTAHRVMTAGYNGGSAEQNALLASTPDNKLAIAYLTSRLSVTIDLSTFAGPVTASWYDPTSGARTQLGQLENRSTRQFTPPGNNAEGSADWALLLRVQ